MRASVIALVCLALAGCASDSIVLVTVESDLAVPAELDEVTVQIEGRSASARLVDGASLPATLELRASGDRLGPFDLRVSGRHGGAEVIAVTRPIMFSPGATVAVTVVLDDACAAVMCMTGEHCEGGACRADAIDAGVGDAAVRDASPGDAGVDAGGPPLSDGGLPDGCAAEACNAADDDCDGEIDEAGCEPCMHRTFGGHVYQVCSVSLAAGAAAGQCALYGYSPLVIDDDAENAFVGGLGSALGGEPWLGLHRVGGTFEWADGSAITYENWQGTEPGSGDCAVMRGNGRWRSEDCAATHPFVCELAP